METIKNNTDYKKIDFYLKIGILGAFIILVADMLMGWGVKDMNVIGIESQLSQYLTVTDKRMFWAAIFGFTGVPIAVVGHYGIYKMLKPYSQKYSKMYAIGMLEFLIFGGAGVHVSSIEAAFFYKYMSLTNSSIVLESTIRFTTYFLLPLYIILLLGWFVMVYAHIRAIVQRLSPLPRWGWIFSMLVGTLLFSCIGSLGNYAVVNALMVGAFSLGNIWTLAGHLWMLHKLENI